MFDLRIEKGVLTLSYAGVEWTRVDGNWYCGCVQTDNRTTEQLDEQFARFVEEMR
jgi:hypothetical protein